jgi:dipeptidyl aminopeptidase/acylaminoacyl peptidase
VHEYAGGSYSPIHLAGYSDSAIFTSFPSNDLHVATLSNGKWTVHPRLEIAGEGAAGGESKRRYADFEPASNRVYCVCEDHADPEPAGVKNSLVCLTLTTPSLCSLTVVAEGSDFYSYPRVNAAGDKIAYVSWNHPNMPWDATTLSIQDLDESASVTVVSDAGSSADPRWRGETLYYVSDANSDLYRMASFDTLTNAAADMEFLDAANDYSPNGLGWSLSVSSYTIHDHLLIAHYCNVDSGAIGVQIINLVDNCVLEEYDESALGYNSVDDLCVFDGRLYFVACSYDKPGCIVSIPLPVSATSAPAAKTTAADMTSVIQTHVNTIQDGDDIYSYTAAFSKPRHVTFSGPKGAVHSYYYPPSATPAPSNEDTPLLVKAHGGPTSSTSISWRLDIQYWTARGYGVLDVNYSGSCGYGREYRERLLGEWGKADLGDVIAGAKWCISEGLCNKKYVAIDGGSAGGYTTLCALAFQGSDGPFTAGCSKYGIADLVVLYSDTHKFESRYMDMLIGTLPEDEKIYFDRCPINHIDGLSCPILLQQGTEDKVVPPNQASLMYNALNDKGIGSILIMYKGEQHGFRNRSNVVHALETEYEFYCKVWGKEVLGGEIWGLVLGESVVREIEE